MGIGMGWTDSWAMEALKEAVNERKERRNDGPHVTRMERGWNECQVRGQSQVRSGQSRTLKLETCVKKRKNL